MIDFKLYDHVKIKSNKATGKIVDITKKMRKKYYCVEYDEEYQHIDKDMGIIYLTGDEIEKYDIITKASES